MIEGSVNIQAGGVGLLEFTKPSAELLFDGEIVIRSKQGLFGAQKKTKYDAFVCEQCSLITFKYE
jgi:hypothetical protein